MRRTKVQKEVLVANKSEAYWEKKVPFLREFYLGSLSDEQLDFEQNKKDRSCLSVASIALIPDGIKLILIGELDLAKKYFEHAVLYAEEAIRADDFAFYRDEPSEGRVLGGKYLQLRTLQLAKWLSTGNRHDELLREALGYFKQWIDRKIRGAAGIGRNPPTLITDLVELGDLEEAKRYCEKHVKPLKAQMPRSFLSERARGQLMYLLACAFTDRPQLKEQAQAGIERFYAELMDWGGKAERHDEYGGALGHSRLQYAYMRGKYFTGLTDPIQLIKNMRHRI